MTVCVLDFETRSAIKLGKGGTNATEYARHPTTGVWCARYAFTNNPTDIKRWWFGDPMPDDLRQFVTNGGTVSAHNAGFEHAIWNELLAKKQNWLHLPIEQMTDTAARAARMGIPRDLEKAAISLNLTMQKDMEGSAQMKRMAKPRKVFVLSDCVSDPGTEYAVTEYEKDPLKYTVVWDGDEATVYEWWATEERMQRLDKYCEQDVATQTEMELILPDLPHKEKAIWLTTMRANLRGHRLDIDFVKRAQEVIRVRLKAYAEDLSQLTDGAITSHTQTAAMAEYARERGCNVPGFAAEVVDKLMTDPSTPEDVAKLAQIRSLAGKTSVAKYPSMLLHAGEDYIAHDQLVYYGAISTGRWSALGYQLHNLPARGSLSYEAAEQCIDLIMHTADVQEIIDGIEFVYESSVIEALSMCLRGAIRARDGMVIVCADYSNIEGRVAAWLANEVWKIKAFIAFDEGRGHDQYKVTAGEILGLSPDEVNKVQRNVMGKVSELSLQFGGGAGAYASMGANYGVDMRDYADTVHEALHEFWAAAEAAWEERGKKHPLPKLAWIAVETIKLAWRDRNPAICQSWRDCEDAAIAAIQSIGSVHNACDGKLKFMAKIFQGRCYLLMRLPSGRSIHYANVRLRDTETPWGAIKKQIWFDKVEQGRVIRSGTWGGDIYQSAVQGTARDIMAHGWMNTDAAGYYGLFSVHDELASETEIDRVDLADYEARLCDIPEWATGCPVTASGYVSDRFRKD